MVYKGDPLLESCRGYRLGASLCYFGLSLCLFGLSKGYLLQGSGAETLLFWQEK